MIFEVGGCRPKPGCGTLVTLERSPELYRQECCGGCNTCEPRTSCLASDRQVSFKMQQNDFNVNEKENDLKCKGKLKLMKRGTPLKGVE